MFFGKSKKKAVSQPKKSSDITAALADVKRGESISYVVWKYNLHLTNAQLMSLRAAVNDRQQALVWKEW